MRRFCFCFLALVLLLPVLPVPGAWALEADEINSETFVLMDYETGQVLFERGMRDRAYPASTTKIMTAILAIENAFPDEIMTVSKDAVQIDEPESSHIALVPDEELSLDTGLFAMMLPSANDAANVIAEHVGGTQDAFAAMMTAKARVIGALDTNFTNPHGLHDDNHYTTAYDLALITRYAVGDERFLRYFGRDLYTMAPTNKQPVERPFTNYQYMLVKTSRFYRSDVIGGKVGYTNEARHTMSTVASRDGRTLICVVMGNPNRDDKFRDTSKLLDLGFSSYREVTVPGESFEPFTVPVRGTDGQTGTVSFRQAGTQKLLLHEDTPESKIRLEYHFPGYYELGGRYTAEVVYLLDEAPSGVPLLLGTQRIIGETELLPGGAVPTAVPILDEPVPLASPASPVDWLRVLLIASVTLLFCFALAILLRRRALKKRRMERARRIHARRLQEENRIQARNERTFGEKLRVRQSTYRM